MITKKMRKYEKEFIRKIKFQQPTKLDRDIAYIQEIAKRVNSKEIIK